MRWDNLEKRRSVLNKEKSLADLCFNKGILVLIAPTWLRKRTQVDQEICFRQKILKPIEMKVKQISCITGASYLASKWDYQMKNVKTQINYFLEEWNSRREVWYRNEDFCGRWIQLKMIHRPFPVSLDPHFSEMKISKKVNSTYLRFFSFDPCAVYWFRISFVWSKINQWKLTLNFRVKTGYQ